MMRHCKRHSYPKGSIQPRRCRNCGHADGGTDVAPVILALERETVAPSTELSCQPLTTPGPMLPEHSPLGGSGVEQWSNCSGSVALIHALKTGEGYTEDAPDYTRDGVEAHALAAHCLETDQDTWEAPLEQFPTLTEDMMSAVQVYLDKARSLPGLRYVETRVHRPEFHPAFYGTLDFAAVQVTEDVAHFVDYKHGAGVLVEVEDNPQLKYYAYGFVGEDKDDYPDEITIRLYIVQPRAHHRDGPIRMWETSAGALRTWAHDELLAAMQATITNRYLSVGKWCQFCPARIICPAMHSLSDEMTYHRDEPLQAYSPERLADFYEKAQALKMFIKAIENEATRRVLGGETVPGLIAVARKSNRIFKDDAPLEETFGEAAYKPREFLTPPNIEKLPDGKTFVAEWAYAPDTGMTVALASSGKTAVAIKSGAATFGAAAAEIA